MSKVRPTDRMTSEPWNDTDVDGTAGNLPQFFATRTAGKFRAHLTETYGAVSLIKGFLGVRLVLLYV